MEYRDIERVNSEIEMIQMGKKDYAMVPERVTAFRKLYPEGFIRTEIVHISENAVLMKATVGFYREDQSEHILATGLAKEEKDKGMVNKTSHIENCETSAVGRALGMVGLGLNGGGICSAEELANAVTAQKQAEAEFEQLKRDKEAAFDNMAASLKNGEKIKKRDVDTLATVEKVDGIPWG